MSLNTGSNTITSQIITGNDTQLMPSSTSLSFDSDQQVDDENRDSLGRAIKKEPGVEVDDAKEQQVKRRREDDGSGLTNQLLTSSSIVCQAINDELLGSSSKLKLVPSIVQLDSLDRVPKGGLKQPFIVTGHIVEHRPAASREAKNTSNSSNLQNLSCMTTCNDSVANNNLWRPSNNYVAKFETNMGSRMNNTNSTASSISTSASSSTLAATRKAHLSRPDLVASSLSAKHADSHLNQTKTRPPLIDHDHKPPFDVNQQSSTRDHCGTALASKNKNSKYDTGKATATTISSQMILSSIITARPGFSTQQLTDGGDLRGLQFCLGSSQQSSGAPSTKFGSSFAGGSVTKTTVKVETEEASLSSSSTIGDDKANSSSAPISGIELKVSSGASDVQMPDKSAPSNGSTNAQGTAAAARLLDLGKRLLEAAKEGQVALVKELVVNAGAPFTSDWLDTTALHIAAQNGSVEIAEILIKGGINKEARTKMRRTALHIAAQSGSLMVTDLLIKNGSDVNCRDMLEMTPLHWAVERGHVCVVERLLMANADYNIKSKFRLTPIDIARNSQFFEIIELFGNWTSGVKDEKNLSVYRNLEAMEATLNESQDFLDIDYHLALVDSAANSQSAPVLDPDEHSLDLVGFEWNKFDFTPDLFLPSSSEEDHNVNHLMKIVEELQRENQQLRQKVEQLSTTDQ